MFSQFYGDHGIIGLDNLKRTPSGEYTMESKDQFYGPQINNIDLNVNNMKQISMSFPNAINVGKKPESPCPGNFRYEASGHGFLTVDSSQEEHIHIVLIFTLNSQLSQVSLNFKIFHI